MNHYLILEINSDANQDEIKKAYRKLVQKYHPDHYGEKSSPFLKIQKAYQVLSDPDLRKKYDKSLTKKPSRISSSKSHRTGYGVKPEPLIPHKKTRGVEEISLSRSFGTFSPSFEEIFERILNPLYADDLQKFGRMENLQVEITISPEEAKMGGSFQLMVPVRIPCPLCHGSGSFGFWECRKCLSFGYIDAEIPVIINYPAGISNNHSHNISLSRYGIDRFYLTIFIRISKEAE